MTDPLEAVVAALAVHVPRDATERSSLTRGRALLRWLRAPLDELADPTHVTGSAIVLDDAGRVLLHRHKRLGIWLQPGGHLEPDEVPAEAAVRETREETGVDTEHPAGGPRLVHVDLHEGPRGHVHLDLRYLLLAREGQELRPAAGESPHVAWLDPPSARARSDASLAAALDAALDAALERATGLWTRAPGPWLTTRPDGPR